MDLPRGCEWEEPRLLSRDGCGHRLLIGVLMGALDGGATDRKSGLGAAVEGAGVCWPPGSDSPSTALPSTCTAWTVAGHLCGTDQGSNITVAVCTHGSEHLQVGYLARCLSPLQQQGGEPQGHSCAAWHVRMLTWLEKTKEMVPGS